MSDHAATSPPESSGGGVEGQGAKDPRSLPVQGGRSFDGTGGGGTGGGAKTPQTLPVDGAGTEG